MAAFVYDQMKEAITGRIAAVKRPAVARERLLTAPVNWLSSFALAVPIMAGVGKLIGSKR